MQNVEPPPFVWPERLFVRLSGQGLCFARYDRENESGLLLSTWPARRQTSLADSIVEACQDDSVAQGPTRNVEVLVGGAVTPIPLTDFQEEDCETYFNYCFPETDTKRRVFYDVIASANVVLLFALDETTCRALEKQFSDVHYSSTLTSVVRHFAQKSDRDKETTRIYAYCHETECDIAAFEGKRLLMLNEYEAHSATDVAYYVLNVAQTLGQDVQDTPLHIAGPTDWRNAAGKELEKYAANVRYLNPIAEFQRHPVALKKDMPYDLMTLLID